MTDPKQSTDLLVNHEPVRTDMYCHNCNKNFIALLRYEIEGNHVIHCPQCGHEHCRVIVGGKVTGDRWDSRHQRVEVERRNVWQHDSLPMQTTSASEFIRRRWLNRSDLQ